ncbi:ankyrin repeat domain-containing protein, partial [Myxococcota bacterium]|nr:ankyrin repeat domain-containing protein [Myxococcota bacterium]
MTVFRILAVAFISCFAASCGLAGGLAWVDHGKDRKTPWNYNTMVSPASSGDVDKLRELLKKKEARINIDLVSDWGGAPLHFAAAAGHLEVVKLLLEHKASLSVKNKHGMTPLHCALEAGRLSVALLLIEAGSPLTVEDNRSRTPLLLATYLGDSAILGKILPKEPRCRKKWCPLHVAAALGYTEAAAMLVKAGHPVNVPAPDNGWTPLHLAASFGRISIVKYLVALKANVNAVSATGVTPLHCAASKGHGAVVRLLIGAGAKNEAVTHAGETPLHLAAREGSAGAVKELLAAKSALCTNKKGQTPIDVAKLAGHPNIEKALTFYNGGSGDNALKILDAPLSRSTIPQKNYSMASDLHNAVSAKNLKRIIELLVLSNELLERKYKYGGPPLLGAVEKNHVI